MLVAVWSGIGAALVEPLFAYVGPGAGFAFVSSFFILLVTFILAFFTLATWPFRWLLATIRGRRALGRSRVRRVVVLGLDGQDPEWTERFMSEGLLPNFQRLKETGGYAKLRTSLPAESPVAWSCFQTGCNPGKHRIFDFFVPDRKTYLPRLASADVEPPKRSLKLGPYQIPLGRPRVSFERKSQSFWKILSDHGIFSAILRVPVTFPPEKFKGLLLSAMSVPDLNGTQGTFAYYSSDKEEQARFTGGVLIPVSKEGDQVAASIQGPPSPFRRDGRRMEAPFRVSLNGEATLRIGKKRHRLPIGEYTEWIPIEFSAGLGLKVRGACRFLLKEASPHFKLYQSPINLDPDRPALPISHPFTFAPYLAKTQGRFCTLGLAEDTWALNERVIDENDFLKQAYLVHEERKSMFFDSLEKTRRGAVVCVFDITDRLQHMFWRYLEADHPANEGKDVEKHRDALRDLYVRMDELVGETMNRLDPETLLLVMSDHGFKSFQRGVNLNSWLQQREFLTLKEGELQSPEWFQSADWSRTRAFAMGLGGIFLNVKGREGMGILTAGEEVDRVKQEIINGLESLVDPVRGVRAIQKVYDAKEAYTGPYAADGPDLIVGFTPGYRVSWESAVGSVTADVFSDNVRSWSGDHCVNPPDVPGILFSNRPFEKSDPSIMDIGPTILDLFGIPVPAFCDGESLMADGPSKDGGKLQELQ